MLIHHVAAVALLFVSFTAGPFRLGVLTLFCMDVCDIFLHFGKIMRLIDNVNGKMAIPMIICYLGLVITWLVFRLAMFPAKVIYTSSVVAMHYGGWPNCDYWGYFNVVLIVVYILQVYWFYLIIMSGYRHIRFGVDFDDDRDPSFDKSRKLNKKQE